LVAAYKILRFVYENARMVAGAVAMFPALSFATALSDSERQIESQFPACSKDTRRLKGETRKKRGADDVHYAGEYAVLLTFK